MKTREEASALAVAMRDIGTQVGLQVRAVISGMDQPLGWAVGNALEVAEAVQTLRGDGPDDLAEVAFTLGAHLLNMGDKTASVEEGVVMMRDNMESGKGLAKFRAFVENQGGDSAFIDNLDLLPQAPVREILHAASDGYISTIDAEAIGRASVDIGAGRAVKSAFIDHSVGFVLHKKIGDHVSLGNALVTIHARTQEAADSIKPALQAAFQVVQTPVAPPPTVLEVIL
jgi:pyrimidine-nucleoside phosphorylase